LKPDARLLMIALQLPMDQEIPIDHIVGAVAEQLREALKMINEKMASGEIGDGAEAAGLGGSTFETIEALTDSTSEDLLETLGYTPAE
jgi:hypothetical protein